MVQRYSPILHLKLELADLANLRLQEKSKNADKRCFSFFTGPEKQAWASSFPVLAARPCSPASRMNAPPTLSARYCARLRRLRTPVSCSRVDAHVLGGDPSFFFRGFSVFMVGQVGLAFGNGLESGDGLFVATQDKLVFHGEMPGEPVAGAVSHSNGERVWNRGNRHGVADGKVAVRIAGGPANGLFQAITVENFGRFTHGRVCRNARKKEHFFLAEQGDKALDRGVELYASHGETSRTAALY